MAFLLDQGLRKLCLHRKTRSGNRPYRDFQPVEHLDHGKIIRSRIFFLLHWICYQYFSTPVMDVSASPSSFNYLWFFFCALELLEAGLGFYYPETISILQDPLDKNSVTSNFSITAIKQYCHRQKQHARNLDWTIWTFCIFDKFDVMKRAWLVRGNTYPFLQYAHGQTSRQPPLRQKVPGPFHIMLRQTSQPTGALTRYRWSIATRLHR